MRGYVWKRGPRADDTDKTNTLKRFLFNNEAYKRRYFVLDTVKLELKYYSDYSRGTELGCIDMLTVVSVDYEDTSGEVLPYKFPWCLTTDNRDWSLCCENEEDYKAWKREINGIMKRREEGTSSDATLSKDARDGMCLSAPPIATTIQRVVMDEAEYKGNSRMSALKSPKRQSSGHNLSRGILNSFSKRKSNFHNDSFKTDMLQMQRARLGEETVSNSYTGNVSIFATSTLSRYHSFEKLNFFQVLMSSCRDDMDLLARQLVVTKFLSECQFEFYTVEGQVLVTEGCKFEFVYFVLEGEIEQRKNWATAPNRIDEKLSIGECAGFVEVLHFNSLSSKTLLVGPGTICLKMSVAVFRKQFMSRLKEKAKFSAAMDPTNNLFTERLLTFTHISLSHLPLLERQPVGNVQTLSHIFTPVFIPSGEHLMDEGVSSRDFYFIIQGSCSVFQKSSLDSDEVDEIVRSCRAGDWLGEAGLIKIQSKHITAVAFSDVIALRTDAAGFKRFLDITGPSVRDAITQSTTTYLSGMLKMIPLFSNIDESLIVDICREVEIRELERDTLLYDTGDKMEDLYVILHGHVKCAISSVSGLDLSQSPPFVDTMRDNDFFGESAVLYENAVSRLQYFTPSDVKVVILRISAKKIKLFLPSCPILQLRFEERLLVRKTHLDLIDTLVNSISLSLSARYDVRASGRARAKPSLGYIADARAKETSCINDEVLYLREEVKRLNGTQYADMIKERSHSRALTTFKSTLRRIKSSLSTSSQKSSPKVPEKRDHRNKKETKNMTKEEAFELAKSRVFRDGSESSVTKTGSASTEFYSGSAKKTMSLSEKDKYSYDNSDSEEEDDDASVDEVLSPNSSTSDDSSSSSVELLYVQKAGKQQTAIDSKLSNSSDDMDQLFGVADTGTTKRVFDARNKVLMSPATTSASTSTSTSTSTPEKSQDRHHSPPAPKKSPPPAVAPARTTATGASPAKAVQESSSPKMTATSKAATTKPAAAKTIGSPAPPTATTPSLKKHHQQQNEKADIPSTSAGNASTGVTHVVDAMYHRMMQMKLPEVAIRKKMTTDCVPVEAIDQFFKNNVGL